MVRARAAAWRPGGRAAAVRPRARHALLAFALVAALLAPPAARARPSRYESVLAPADSFALRGQPERAAAYADSLLLVAQASGNAGLEAVVASRRVLNWIGAGRLDDGAREAPRVAAIARSVRDTLSWSRALLAAGRAQLFRNRLAEAGPPYRELLRLARAIRDGMLEGNARLGLAYLDLSANRVASAETGYRRAIALLEQSRDARGEMAARVGLARVLREQGRNDDARRSYEAIIARCAVTGDRVSEADAWNNLGELEAAEGNPAKGADDIARSVRIMRSFGRARPTAVRNLAIMLVQAGQVEAAAETLASEIARWPRGALRATYPARTQLALLRTLQGRTGEGERMLREQWAARDSASVPEAADAGVRLVQVLVRAGRLAEARSLASELERLAAGRLGPAGEVARIQQLVDLDLRSGSAAEALERLRRLRASGSLAALGIWQEHIETRLLFSRAFHALGRPDSAIAQARAAGEAWERTAAGVREAEWLEPIGNGAARLAIQTARVLLDPRRDVPAPRRAREAFDAVQRFKSRALEWRAAGRGAAAAGLTTAAALQQHHLRAGEVLVDSYSSLHDSTVVFALDRGAIRVHWLAAGDDEDIAVGRALAVLQSADGSTAPFRSGAARRLAADCFGATLELVRPARLVYVSLSGLLNTLPLAALPADTSADTPMVEGRAIVAVPSASWLARARRAPPASVAAARVVTVARTTDDRARPLAGVGEEARWLRSRYGGAGLVHAGDRPLAAVVPWLARGDILHVASHARASSRDPWGSAFLLGQGGGEGAWLTAREIAARRVSARLAVLASCRSTIDRGYSNESVLGLARAFLAAGVPAVLSTQWPVDDRATAEFIRRFYLGLERGLTASAALREAQLSTRRQAGSAAPYYWAGFVLAGDPGTRTVPARGR